MSSRFEAAVPLTNGIRRRKRLWASHEERHSLFGSAAGIDSHISAGCENQRDITNQQVHSSGIDTLALGNAESPHKRAPFDVMRISNNRKGLIPGKTTEAQFLKAFSRDQTAVLVHDTGEASHEVSIITAAIWRETMPPATETLTELCELLCSVAVIVGFAQNIYLAANKKRFEHEKMATEQPYQHRLRHFAGYIDTDLVFNRETLAQNISKLTKREIINCLPLSKSDYREDLSSIKAKQIWLCCDIENVIIHNLSGAPRFMSHTYGEKEHKHMDDSYHTITSESQRYDHAYQGQAKIDALPVILSIQWPDLWHFMSVEAGQVTFPYHFRVIGDLMSVISNELLHYKEDEASRNLVCWAHIEYCYLKSLLLLEDHQK
ncbi:hypothetical protein JCM33374_g6306 [Metschnikowia sp. JCM 33374]|nr:hypothetical protein JCM33374_g6306 [Metschnikowia sp. JCM 33374]